MFLWCIRFMYRTSIFFKGISIFSIIFFFIFFCLLVLLIFLCIVSARRRDQISKICALCFYIILLFWPRPVILYISSYLPKTKLFSYCYQASSVILYFYMMLYCYADINLVSIQSSNSKAVWLYFLATKTSYSIDSNSDSEVE